MGVIGSFLDGLGRFIASAFGFAGNTFGESKTLREELAKQREASEENREP